MFKDTFQILQHVSLTFLFDDIQACYKHEPYDGFMLIIQCLFNVAFININMYNLNMNNVFAILTPKVQIYSGDKINRT